VYVLFWYWLIGVVLDKGLLNGLLVMAVILPLSTHHSRYCKPFGFVSCFFERD